MTREEREALLDEAFLRLAREYDGAVTILPSSSGFLAARRAVLRLVDAAEARADALRAERDRLREAVASLSVVGQEALDRPQDLEWEEKRSIRIRWNAAKTQARAALAGEETSTGTVAALPPEIREILRDVAAGVSGPDLRGRCAAAIVARDLCPRCAGTGMELLDIPGTVAWGVCHGCASAGKETKP